MGLWLTQGCATIPACVPLSWPRCCCSWLGRYWRRTAGGGSTALQPRSVPTAEKLAREAMAIPARADAARVVLGRIQLERYRQSSDRERIEPGARIVARCRHHAARRCRARRVDDRFGRGALFRREVWRGGAAVRIRASAFGASGHARARTGARLVGDCRGPSGADAAA